MQRKDLEFLINILVNKYAAKKQQAKNHHPGNECLLFEERIRSKSYHLANLWA